MPEEKSTAKLTQLVTEARMHNNRELAQDIMMCLWETYDPKDSLIYPTVEHWDKLLTRVMENDSYALLSKDEVLSILFGLNHRTRIVDGLWWSMFERGVTQKLLVTLLANVGLTK